MCVVIALVLPQVGPRGDGDGQAAEITPPLPLTTADGNDDAQFSGPFPERESGIAAFVVVGEPNG